MTRWRQQRIVPLYLQVCARAHARTHTLSPLGRPPQEDHRNIWASQWTQLSEDPSPSKRHPPFNEVISPEPSPPPNPSPSKHSFPIGQCSHSLSSSPASPSLGPGSGLSDKPLRDETNQHYFFPWLDGDGDDDSVAGVCVCVTHPERRAHTAARRR